MLFLSYVHQGNVVLISGKTKDFYTGVYFITFSAHMATPVSASFAFHNSCKEFQHKAHIPK